MNFDRYGRVERIHNLTLVNADCMQILKDLPDNYADLACVDPPYGINANQMNMGSRATVKPNKKKWDEAPPSEEYFRELQRISSNQIIWGGNYFRSIWPTRGFLVWDKGETMKGRSFAECEQAWTSFDVSARIYKQSPNDATRIHPTQKPVKLYDWLLSNYSEPGQRILDTHLGSGSSAIAAHYFGCEFVGIELDEDYYKAAVQRITEQTRQLDLLA